MHQEGEEVNAWADKKSISDSDSGLRPLLKSEAIPELKAKEKQSRPSTPSTSTSTCSSPKSVESSGPDGQILESDLTSYTQSLSTSIGSAAAAGATPPYNDVPTSAMQRAIAGRFTDSKRNVPHYYLTSEIQMDRMNSLRMSLNKATLDSAHGGVQAPTKLTVNDFVIKGVALACVDVPAVNAEWHGDFIRQFNTIDISVVVDTPTGLSVPVVKDAGSKGLISISSQVKASAEQARKNLINPDEYEGGTFMISNLGMYGSVSHFTSIIKQPQACILTVGGVDKKLVMDASSEKGFKEIEIMKVTLNCDHRVIDGAVAARWLKAFKSHMENPVSFML